MLVRKEMNDFVQMTDIVSAFESILSNCEIYKGFFVQIIGGGYPPSTVVNLLSDYTSEIKLIRGVLRPAIVEAYINRKTLAARMAAASWQVSDRVSFAIAREFDVGIWKEFKKAISPSYYLGTNPHRNTSSGIVFSMVCSKGEYDEDFFFEY